MRYGYHYTSWENWQKIKREGLKPYDVSRPEFAGYFKKVRGVFTWKRKLTGVEHYGSIAYQAHMRGTLKIVELRFRYSNAQILKYKGSNMLMWHSGTLSSESGGKSNEMDYHKAVSSVIVVETIPASQIELVGVYDLVKRLKR
jgi:hypothetical protein